MLCLFKQRFVRRKATLCFPKSIASYREGIKDGKMCKRLP